LSGSPFGATFGFGVAITVPAKKKLGEILVSRNILTAAQLEKVQHGQAMHLMPLGSTALEMQLASERDVTMALAEQFGVPGAHLSASTISTEVLGAVPSQVASGHFVLPLAFKGNALLMALANPSEKVLVDEIAFASGRAILPYVAPRVVLERVIRAAYDARANATEFWIGQASEHKTEAHVEVIEPPLKTKTPIPAPALDKITVPAKLEDVVAGAKPEVAPRTSDKPLVLAVDDEVEILDIIDKALSHKGMDVVRATRGREALERLQAHVPDIVLLDAMLPEIHGFEICHKIKQSQQFKHVPVIIISAIYTGWNFITDIKRNYGADDYMAKPFRVMELVRKVEETLAKSQVRPRSPEVAQAHKAAELLLKEAADALKANRVEAAVDAAERSTRADPFDPRTHFILGMALHKAGRIYEAISVYERVVELNPGQFPALKNLAVLYERQGFKAKAVEMWMRALEQSPSEPVRQTIKAHLIDLL
jgi:DNA-binding response OmpR family regulator